MPTQNNGVGGFSYRRFQLGLGGLLAIHIFSNPNLSSLTLWLSMGGLLALQAWQRKAGHGYAALPIAVSAATPGWAEGRSKPLHASV